jgi:hypothetical protein
LKINVGSKTKESTNVTNTNTDTRNNATTDANSTGPERQDGSPHSPPGLVDDGSLPFPD